MRGGEGWRTPEDSWMELEDAQDENYFVNFLLEDEENKADPPPPRQTPSRRWKGSWQKLSSHRFTYHIDSNIHSRVKGAGVEVPSPKDVTMSEAERDRVCEEIGNEPGLRVKRRKEIEKMGEDEIEAKIERTKEAIAENLLRHEGEPKASMGKLPWLLMLLGVMRG